MNFLEYYIILFLFFYVCVNFVIVFDVYFKLVSIAIVLNSYAKGILYWSEFGLVKYMIIMTQILV